MDDAVFSVEPTPAGVNPYVGPGLAGVPRVLYRVMPTPDRLAHEARTVLFYREHDLEWLAVESGVPIGTVNEILEEGTGCLGDILDVLAVLGVVPVELPGPPALRPSR